MHGLGYDPTTGRTYAATHHGVWLLSTEELPDTYGNGTPDTSGGEETQPIAGRAQDTMGFLVTETGLLLGSGHPDPAEEPSLSPANLGLISSTDGAETWDTVSLRGETDFHDLAAAPLPSGELRIYGYDAERGTIRVSDTSGTTWIDGAALQMRDLTTDPGNPARVFATTAAGLMVSDDAAQTFAPAIGAPALYLVDAATASTETDIVGVDTQGNVWHSTAEGPWISGGTTQGIVEALTVVGGQSPWILVSDDRGVMASADYGQNWIALLPR